MTEKIKEILVEFLKDKIRNKSIYKYRINHSYYVKFEPISKDDCIRVYLGCELPGYESVKSEVYKFSYGTLNDDIEGLADFVLMLYKETEKMNKDSISIGYDIYKSLVADNERLRDQIKQLEKEVENWKQSSIENHNSYLSAIRGYEEYQQKYLLEQKKYEEYRDKYFEEKLNHTTTEARIVFAQHILSGNREDRVKDFWNNHREYVDMYRNNDNRY